MGSDPRAEQICGTTYAARLFEQRGLDGCFPGCNLRCTKGGSVTLTSGGHRERVWVDGPEYETAAAFGSNLGIWHPEFIMEANWHCDNYGIDTITVAVIMAFIMECFQRGYLTQEDTGGLELNWGDEKAALAFIHQVAHRETELAAIAGRGMEEVLNWVADKYARRTGEPAPIRELERFVMQAKGLPFSLYRTHRSLSMQGSYAAASDIGAHHAAAWLIKVDLLGAFPTLEAKARALITYPRVRLGNDNLGLCKLPWVDVFNPEKDYHDQELSRFLRKPLSEIAVMEPSEKREILIDNRKEQLRKLIRIYYQERDWNASGIPTIDTLKRIGLWDFLNEEVKTKISEVLAA